MTHVPIDLRGDERAVDFADRSWIFGAAPQFYADSFGVQLEGGLSFPVTIRTAWPSRLNATAVLQSAGSDAHWEFGTLAGLKARGAFYSTELSESNPYSAFRRLVAEPSNNPVYGGCEAAIGFGAGLVNYWLTPHGEYLPLGVAFVNFGIGAFLESEGLRIGMDLAYQLDVTSASLRSFVTIPIYVVFLNDGKSR